MIVKHTQAFLLNGIPIMLLLVVVTLVCRHFRFLLIIFHLTRDLTVVFFDFHFDFFK